jgi:hypothetical protein
MKEILQETAKELNLPTNVVEKVIKAYMLFVKNKISKFRYQDLESLVGVKTNFFIPGLGKLVVKNKERRKKYEKHSKEITN